MKRIALIGSAGSIGESTLRVVEAAPEKFKIVGLATGRNYQRLFEQAKKHRPRLAAVATEVLEKFTELARTLEMETLAGEEGAVQVALMEEAEVVVIAAAGAASLAPALAAAKAGKTLALANKECLVMAGELIIKAARESGAVILPVDSEHSGIFQALAGRPLTEVRRIILPASGGPFLDTPADQLQRVTPEQALCHPTWSMGKKITIDSATLMNKAFEIIEARWLFGIEPSRIEVLIHPESLLHGAVEFNDGSMVAQISATDMRLPILHALAWPERIDIGLPRLELEMMKKLTFRTLKSERFPAPDLARRALEMGGSAPATLAGADEAAVEAFLEGRLPFSRIVELVAEVLQEHVPEPITSLEKAREADRNARERIRKKIP